MQNTTNYNLKKPEYTDFADIADINDNMDTIDAQLAAPTGDSADSTTTFTTSDTADGSASSWTTVPALTSGETHKSLFAKMSQMFKNVRYLYKLLGTTDISSIGNGTVTNALSVLNANFKTPITSDSALDSLLGNCFFGGGGYTSSYFDVADYNGIQIDNGGQRTQIVVAAQDLLYRVDDNADGHTGAWSAWYTLPYNTATLLSTLSSGKFDKSNVANNVTTTSSGYALDARQGKALNDAIVENAPRRRSFTFSRTLAGNGYSAATVMASELSLQSDEYIKMASVHLSYYGSSATFTSGIQLAYRVGDDNKTVLIDMYNSTASNKAFNVQVECLVTKVLSN